MAGGIFMSLQEVFQEKLEEYTRDYGFEAGLDLLLMEIEAELWEVIGAQTAIPLYQQTLDNK